MSDYTPRKEEEDEAFALPPVPDAQVTELGTRLYFYHQMERYACACAEHVRAPLVEENTRLLARIAELEASLYESSVAGMRMVRAADDEIDRLRERIAELERRLEESESCLDNAVSKAPEPLRALGEYLGRLLDDDDWPEAERHINAAAISCDRLRAEVQKLTASNDALTEANASLRAERYRWLRQKTLADGVQDLDAQIDTARKGEAAKRAAQRGEGE